MIYAALGSLLAGILCGRFLFSPEIVQYMDQLVSIALKILVFSVGIDVGSNKAALYKMKEYHIKVLIIPFGIAVGSIGSGILLGFALGMPMNQSGAIGAGMGWYSLSAVMLRGLGGAQLGTTAFLANIFRELLSFICIPFIAKYLGYYTAIAPAGATAMDTCLPIIARSTDETTAVLSVISGVICTAMVPILITFLYQFLAG